MKGVLFSEGVGFIHVICQTHVDALRWQRRFQQNRNFKSVELNNSEDVVLGARTQYNHPYKHIVSAEKHGWWFSDEFPFRAGLKMLFRSTVLSAVEESRLVSSGVLSRV